jgi:hypothetical protein
LLDLININVNLNQNDLSQKNKPGNEIRRDLGKRNSIGTLGKESSVSKMN